MKPDVAADDLTCPAADPCLWPLDPSIVFLNHGSFGSCPVTVLERQSELRRLLEREPVTFLVRELEGKMDESRAALADFVGAASDDVVFVPNTTTGVNTVLKSLKFEPGDELLVTDHEYNACRNALDFVAERGGASIVVAKLPFPSSSPEDVVGRIVEKVTRRTRLVLVDHVTSQTGLILPVQRLARELNQLGVDLLVDGAHSPGMIHLNLQELGAAFYTGNCHKWICSPKGAGFLHVRRDKQSLIRPLTISHGANSKRQDRSRFQIEFAWTGTWDPTAMLCVKDALDFMGRAVSGGWPYVMERNRRMAIQGRRLLCDALEIEAPCCDELIGSLASVPIPDAKEVTVPRSPLYLDTWQDLLMERHRIEVPIIPWPSPPKRLLRISAQLYNHLGQYRMLAAGLQKLLREGKSS